MSHPYKKTTEKAVATAADRKQGLFHKIEKSLPTDGCGRVPGVHFSCGIGFARCGGCDQEKLSFWFLSSTQFVLCAACLEELAKEIRQQESSFGQVPCTASISEIRAAVAVSPSVQSVPAADDPIKTFFKPS